MFPKLVHDSFISGENLASIPEPLWTEVCTSAYKCPHCNPHFRHHHHHHPYKRLPHSKLLPPPPPPLPLSAQLQQQQPLQLEPRQLLLLQQPPEVSRSGTASPVPVEPTPEWGEVFRNSPEFRRSGNTGSASPASTDRSSWMGCGDAFEIGRVAAAAWRERLAAISQAAPAAQPLPATQTLSQGHAETMETRIGDARLVVEAQATGQPPLSANAAGVRTASVAQPPTQPPTQQLAELPTKTPAHPPAQSPTQLLGQPPSQLKDQPPGQPPGQATQLPGQHLPLATAAQAHATPSEALGLRKTPKAHTYQPEGDVSQRYQDPGAGATQWRATASDRPRMVNPAQDSRQMGCVERGRERTRSPGFDTGLEVSDILHQTHS